MALRVGPDGLAEFCAQHPIALSPDLLVPRMIVQRGIYTLHTFEQYALEVLANDDRSKHGDACFLHKIVIPGNAKSGLRSALSIVAGVTEETLFPDIDGFARDFVMEQRRIASGEIGSAAH